jgi:hypothetical protein
MRMSQNRKSWIITVVVSLVLFVLSTESWADPLVINYSNPSMTFGSTQNLSASGGCPPYTWRVFGGGTLSADLVYTAPTSNPNCANNPMIVLTDSCGNMADIQIAVTNANQQTALRKNKFILCYIQEGTGTEMGLVEIRYWHCDGQMDSDCYTAAGSQGPCPWCYDGPCDCSDLQKGPPDGDNYYCTIGSRSFQCNLCSGGTCDVLYDLRNQGMKDDGCCPLNPDTGLPVDGGPGSEALGEGAGDCLFCDLTEGKVINLVANPVNIATGNKYEQVLDLSISTPGLPLEFRRSYNSQVIFNSPMGYGWTHTYQVSLGVVQTSPTKRVRIWDSDGRALYFSEVQQVRFNRLLLRFFSGASPESKTGLDRSS